MSVSFNGFNEQTATFAAVSGVTAGHPVKMSANNTVTECSADDVFIGVATDVNGGYASVQIEGCVTVGYTGTAPTVGYSALCGGGSGKIEVDATNGMLKRVLSVDTTAETATILL